MNTTLVASKLGVRSIAAASCAGNHARGRNGTGLVVDRKLTDAVFSASLGPAYRLRAFPRPLRRARETQRLNVNTLVSAHSHRHVVASVRKELIAQTPSQPSRASDKPKRRGVIASTAARRAPSQLSTSPLTMS
ncbi:hypothetical protein [Xanthomonas nasturtii]|uniref:hypothetical protein n=1 Tax=Xanthomonas nasturtii TaxID=1843581 RepID=UPI00137B2045|nr:hypothetical protein [Xanthomonas nasturtii]WVL56593.1 hypothetical protein M3O54_020230 [Xanthomonas nasturtii]